MSSPRKKRQVKKPESSVSMRFFRSKLSQGNTGFYILLDFEPFTAQTNLPSTHVKCLPVKLERRWIWSAQNPSEQVLHFLPSTIRQVVPLDSKTACNIVNDEEFLKEVIERHDDADIIQRVYDEEKQEIKSEVISVQPPMFAFSHIPFNRNLFQSRNCYRAEICYIVVGDEPESESSRLPFNQEQCIAGFSEETKASMSKEAFDKPRVQVVEKEVEMQCEPPSCAPEKNMDLNSSCYVLVDEYKYKVRTHYNNCYPQHVEMTTPSAWIWSNGDPEKVPVIYTPALQVTLVRPLQPDSLLPVKQLVVQPPIIAVGGVATTYPYFTPHYVKGTYRGTYEIATKPKCHYDRLPFDSSELKIGVNSNTCANITHDGINYLNLPIPTVEHYYILLKLPEHMQQIDMGSNYPKCVYQKEELVWIYSRCNPQKWPILYTPKPRPKLVPSLGKSNCQKLVYVTYPTYELGPYKPHKKAKGSATTPEILVAIRMDAQVDLMAKLPTADLDIRSKNFLLKRLETCNISPDDIPHIVQGYAHNALKPATGYIGYEAAERYFYEPDSEHFAPLSQAVFGVNNPFLPPDPWMDYDPLCLFKDEISDPELARTYRSRRSSVNNQDQLGPAPPSTPTKEAGDQLEPLEPPDI